MATKTEATQDLGLCEASLRGFGVCEFKAKGVYEGEARQYSMDKEIVTPVTVKLCGRHGSLARKGGSINIIIPNPEITQRFRLPTRTVYFERTPLESMKAERERLKYRRLEVGESAFSPLGRLFYQNTDLFQDGIAAAGKDVADAIHHELDKIERLYDDNRKAIARRSQLDRLIEEAST